MTADATTACTPAPETMTSRPAAGTPACQPAGSFRSVTVVESKMKDGAPMTSESPLSRIATPADSNAAVAADLIAARSVASGVVTTVSPWVNAAVVNANVPESAAPAPSAPTERPGWAMVIVPALPSRVASAVSALAIVKDCPAPTLSVPIAVREFAEKVVVPPCRSSEYGTSARSSVPAPVRVIFV